MKTFEMFSVSKKGENGRRNFKVILYKIHPDECEDTVNGVGTEYNLNGITWLRKYCEEALPSIKGMSIRCEFLDEDRVEICGHGFTEIKDDVPLFENATVIGHFTDGYIEEMYDENGDPFMACIGVGEIDSSCYNKFCEKLDELAEENIYPQGSVEIMRVPGTKGIEYKYGYKDYGRIPTKFIHSGYALLAIKPSDSAAKLLELNNKEDNQMNEKEAQALIDKTLSSYKQVEQTIADAKADCEAKIEEANAAVNAANAEKDAVIAEKNELNATVEQLQAALDAAKAEYAELDKKYNTLWDARAELEKALGEAKAKELIGEMNEAISIFSAEEQEYAKESIEKFKADPTSVEINSIVSEIYVGIGKAKKSAADAEKQSEINSATDVKAEDIFSVVDTTENGKSSEEDYDIFSK
jgi:predicted nuclease with TOPRIM domain